MGRRILAGLIVLVAGGARPLLADETAAAPSAAAPCAACVPEFSILTLDGGILDTESLRGRVTFLHFFHSTDAPIDDMWPEMQTLSLWSKKTRVQVIGVAAERDERVVRRFLQDRGITWPVCVDAEQKVRAAFGVTKVPAQIVVDHEGRVVYRAALWSAAQTTRIDLAMDKAVDALRKAQKAEAKAFKDEQKEEKKKPAAAD